MAKRRNFSAAFKAKVALEALQGDATLAADGAALTSAMTGLWSAARCQLMGCSPARRCK